MKKLGLLLLAAATVQADELGKPHVGGLKFHRHHAVANGPVPPGGPVMAAGMTGGGGGMADPFAGRRFPNTRSQLYFVDPAGMTIGWQTSSPSGERSYVGNQLTVPARYNFNQGYIYRLKLSSIPGREGLNLYPTIEVAPSTPVTDAYLTHNPIPIQFTDEDLDQVSAGNFVTKVIYLPDPKYQELAIAGVETLVSTRLEPGVDPVAEADRRGTILAIVRLGAIDLEMPANGVSIPNVGPVTIPGAAAGTVLPPGALPPGLAPAPRPEIETVPVDRAPVAPAPAPGAEAAPAPANRTVPPPAPAPSPAAEKPEEAPKTASADGFGGIPQLSDEIPPAPVAVPDPVEPGEIQLSTPR
jgi:hypothetical protein